MKKIKGQTMQTMSKKNYHKNLFKISLIIVLITFISSLFIMTGCDLTKAENVDTPDSVEEGLMNSNNFNDINVDNVESLEIINIGVGGKESKTITNHDEIVKKYNYLNSFKIGDKTNRVAEDNTTIYKFKQNDKVISITIEDGDILVIDSDRYDLIKK